MQKASELIVITGGCGAIGVNLVNKLLADGRDNIHVVDNLSSGTNGVPGGVEFSNIDIGNREKTDRFFDEVRPTAIFHLAAHFANQNSVDHPLSDTATNVVGLINILEAQVRNTDLGKFVYASSSCVYGHSEFMSETDDVSPFDTPYAINKYAGELYCKYYSEIKDVPTVCGRIFNNFGPGEEPGAYRNVIPNFILRALRNEDIPITGTGDETRDFTYVDNTVDLLLRMESSPYSNADAFNSGTGVGLSIRELAETIVDVTGSSSKITYTPPRSWDRVKHRRSNIAKSRELLGYDPQPRLREELQSTVDWIRKHVSL